MTTPIEQGAASIRRLREGEESAVRYVVRTWARSALSTLPVDGKWSRSIRGADGQRRRVKRYGVPRALAVAALEMQARALLDAGAVIDVVHPADTPGQIVAWIAHTPPRTLHYLYVRSWSRSTPERRYGLATALFEHAGFSSETEFFYTWRSAALDQATRDRAPRGIYLPVARETLG